jgi:hypothetical protein
MREHAGFLAVVAAGVVAIGAGLITIGVVVAQTGAAGGASLDLWGNVWFVLGICVIGLGAAVLIAACIMYLRKPLAVPEPNRGGWGSGP